MASGAEAAVDLPVPLNGTAESNHEPRKGRRTRWGQSASDATLEASSGSGATAPTSGAADAASQSGLSLSNTSSGTARGPKDAGVNPSADEAAVGSSATPGVAHPLLVTALRPLSKPVTGKPGVTTTSHIISDVASRAAAARAALEKAKKALAMQKQIQEQVSAMRAGQAGTSMAARGANALITAGVAAALRAMPQLKPMRFDRLGREIDAEGKVIDIKPLARSTLKVNINKEREAKLKQVVFQAKVDKNLTNPSVNRFFDPNLHVVSTKSRSRGLSFVEKGFYSKRERQMRAREQAQNMGLSLLSGEEKKRKEEEEQRRLEKVLQYQRDHQPEDPNDPDRMSSNAAMSDPPTGQLASANVERNALMAAVAAAAAAVESRRGVDTTLATSPGISPEEAEEDQDMLMRPGAVTRRHEALHILQRRQTGIIPDIEWWDQPLLGRQDETHMFEDEDPAFPYVIAEATITDLVEHPVPIPPVVDIESPVAPVLHLTPKERLKLRRRKRQEREKDKQDKIRMGLIPPPPPKVKLANLARVLGTSAAADPSRVEQRVREQVAERQRAHQERNEARKLDAEARRKKKIAKWTQPSSEVQVPPGGAETCVFSIKDLSNRAHLFKVDKNAQQFHVTGAAIICPQFGNLVIAEGSRKALRGYKKLLLRRIKWSAAESQSTAEETLLDGSKDTTVNSAGKVNGSTEITHTEADVEEEEESVPLKGRGSRLCRLLWEGVVKDRAFRQWRVYVCKSEAEVRKLLADRHCEHYWDMLKKYRDFSEDL